MGQERYISMNKCKDGHLYIIEARNADIGVYVESEKAFRIRRNKFQLTFIDKEYHWDIEPMEVLPSPFPKLNGTVKPLKKLNYLGNMSDEKLLETLNDYMKTLYYDIKKLKGHIRSSYVIIDSDRFKKLRRFKGGN